MGRSRTISEIKSDFGQKSHFLLPWGFPLEFCNGGGLKKPRLMPLPDDRNSFMIFPFVEMQYHM